MQICTDFDVGDKDMKIRHLITTFAALSTVSLMAFGWDPMDDPYGKPGCDPYTGPETQAGNDDKKNSDPINLASGDFQEVRTDLFIPGRGLDFELTRFYRSLSGLQSVKNIADVTLHLVDVERDAPLGDHWALNYNMRLTYQKPEFDPITNPGGNSPDPLEPDEELVNEIVFISSTGRADRYSKYEPSGPKLGLSTEANYSNDHFARKIVYTYGDEPVYLYEADLTVYEFFPAYQTTHTNFETTTVRLPFAGRLKSITDRNDNQITFSWETVNGVERIDYVTDTLGHPINFIYHNETYPGYSSPLAGMTFTEPFKEQLLWLVADHADRVVQFDYVFVDTSGLNVDAPLLSEVTLPAIKNSSSFNLPAEHARFPSGSSWNYEYKPSVSSDGIWRGRLLTKITNPNGDVTLENEYNEFGEQENPNTLRVLRQIYGDAEYNYMLTDLNGNYFNISGDLDIQSDYFVWVNDRRGAITRFKYSGESGTGFYRQLLEIVEYEGFVSDPKRSTWAELDNNGNILQWRYLSPNYQNSESQYNSPVTHNGPLNSDGSLAYKKYVETFDTNDNWVLFGGTSANGDSWQQDPWRAPQGNWPGSSTTDPLRWGAVEKRTKTSDDGTESITEEWRYNLILTGGGSGCGCGTSGLDTAYKDGNGYVTVKEYDLSTGDLLKIYHDLPPSVDIDMLPSNPENLAAAIDSYTYNQYGQVLTHEHPSKLGLDSDGDPALVPLRVDQFEYYSNVNDSNNYGRLHKVHVDVNGFDLVTTYEYDAIGNVIKIIEPSEVDDLGIVIQTGDISTYLYNQSSQLVQEQHFDWTGLDLYSQTDYFYDKNGNMVRQEIKNINENLAVAANESITSIYEYDEHDFRTVFSQEAGVYSGVFEDLELIGDTSGRFDAPETNDLFVTKKFVYDGGKKLIEVQFGEAVNGITTNQVSNIVQFEYDARELLVKKTQGQGAASPLVTGYEYDDKGRRIETTVNPGIAATEHSTQFVYDAFDRLVKRVDPLLNEYVFEYDDNHNPILLQVLGPVLEDTHTAAGNVVLAEVARVYGALDLLDTQSVEVFDYNYSPPGVPLPASAPQVTTYSYNTDSSVRSVMSPAGNGTTNTENSYYDTASRLEFNEDIAGNITQYSYDADSNVSKMSQTDISSLDGSVEIFEVLYEYDALNRPVVMVDGVGNRTESKFDSRSNTIEIEDARNKLNLYTYDSMSRLVSTSLGNGTVTTAKGYDASSRLISEVDANGNETKYEYDGLNRLTKIIMPDDEFYQAQYDSFGNMSQYTDARGVVVTQNFDLNNRIYNRVINDSAVLDDSGAYVGIPGTASEDYTYDGLGRLRTAENDFSKITREYDSRSNVIRELQNIDSAGGFPIASDREVSYQFDLANNTTQLTYPGGREIYRTFDALNRMVGIFNDDQFADPISEFEYTGRRLQRREHGNGTRTDYVFNGINNGSNGVTNAAGDFGFGRVSSISTTKVSSGNTLDAFTFAWDETQNRTLYNDTGSGMKNRRERTFGYDDANRLVSTDVDFPDPLTDNTSPTNNGITSYTLDGVYNRTDVSGFESNGAPIGAYTQAGDQAKNNQYTLTPRAAGGEWINFHDENGNLIQKYQSTIADFNGDYTVNYFDISAFLTAYNALDPTADVNNDGSFNFLDVSAFLGENSALDNTQLEQWYYSYDFRNQLIEAKQVFGPTDMTLRSINTYDAAARRVIESLDADGDGSVDTEKQLVYGCNSLWEVIEQIDIATDTTILTHVYGLGIDNEVSYQYEELSGLVDIWAHRDDLNSLTSITDSNGDVLERYEYGDYGKVLFLDATGISIPSTSYQAIHLYTGRSLITGIGMYDYRYRVMEPETGRFIQQDPIGYVDGMNLYTYVGLNPLSYFDPLGLFSFRYDNTFTGTQKKMLDDSRDRIRKRLIDLNDQMDSMSECMKNELFKRGGALRELRKKLRKLNNAFKNDSGPLQLGGPLVPKVKFDQQPFPNIYAESKVLFRAHWIDDHSLSLNSSPTNPKGVWTSWEDGVLDSTIFHELMHWAEGFLGKNKDGDYTADDPHLAEDLMRKDFDDLYEAHPIKVAINAAKKKCKKGCEE